MGLTAKKARSLKRKTEKAKAKAAKRALYASYAGQGRRSTKTAASGRTPQRGNHVMADCGNVGCEACYPQYRAFRQNEPNPTRWPRSAATALRRPSAA